MNVRRLAIATAFGVALSACGGGDSPISFAERARLLPLVERVRHAADAHDRPAAERSLTELRRAVTTAEARGDISAGSADEIRAAATQVESGLALVPLPTTTTTTAPADVGRGNGDQQHDRGKDKGRKAGDAGGGPD